MVLFSPTTARSLLACLLGGLSASLHAADASGSSDARSIVPGFERFYAAATADTDVDQLTEGGLLLLQEMNCVACHAVPEPWQTELGTRNKLSLETVGDRLHRTELVSFISNPAKHKPGTLMPQVFHGDKESLENVVSYLRSLQSAEKKAFPESNVEEGRTLFHTIGCVACHEPASPQSYQPAEAVPGMAVEKPKVPSVPIRLAHDYPHRALAEFLQAPLKVRHAGRMPDFQLTDQQASNIAAYLQEGIAPKKWHKDEASGPQIEAGKKIFAEQNCIACHDTGKNDPAMKPAKTVAQLHVGGEHGTGCLATQAAANAAYPHYTLSETQRRAITLALLFVQKNAPPAVDDARRSDRFLTQMNCYACHEWQGKGGLEKARAQYFTVYEPSAHSLGEIGILPPKLNHAGRKLTRQWMEKLLWGEGGGVRPYMTARMPKFGKENAASFITSFAKACKNANPVTIDTSGLQKHHRAAYGRTLIGVGEGALGCISCHGLKDRKSLGVPVVNLTHTAERMQPEYFKELLLNPQAVQPGTLMPPLFIGRKKADIEIEQLWTYLKEIDQSPLPDGLLTAGDYELKPKEKNKTMVFRTFLEGAGTEAIAIGFPSEQHIAFDSHEIRWAIAWKGRFIDAMTTWEERAMTPAKPLGEALLTFPVHMPFAQLKSSGEPWPDGYGENAGYKFKGFRVRPADGVPIFTYTINGLTVEEVVEPRGEGLHRQITLRAKNASSEKNWYFLGLGKGARPRLLEWKDGTVSLEEQITW